MPTPHTPPTAASSPNPRAALRQTCMHEIQTNKKLRRCLLQLAGAVLASVLVMLAMVALGAGMPGLSSIFVTSALVLWVKALRGVSNGW
jgi:hypothetical protein